MFSRSKYSKIRDQCITFGEFDTNPGCDANHHSPPKPLDLENYKNRKILSIFTDYDNDYQDQDEKLESKILFKFDKEYPDESLYDFNKDNQDNRA